VLNRRQPYAPTAFAGGHDTRLDVLDLQWSPNRERDVLGYRVVRDGLLSDTQVCPAPSAGGMLAPTQTSCAVASPPTIPATYELVAFDRDTTATHPLRVGDAATLLVSIPSLRPAAPGGLQVATVSGRPKLTWDRPSTGSVSFYRIYRDGTAVGYNDRYDRTSDDTPTFTDAAAGDGPHAYWVTAVNSSFNESSPIGPATWPAP
jgi:hypothetical protein